MFNNVRIDIDLNAHIHPVMYNRLLLMHKGCTANTTIALTRRH